MEKLVRPVGPGMMDRMVVVGVKGFLGLPVNVGLAALKDRPVLLAQQDHRERA